MMASLFLRQRFLRGGLQVVQFRLQFRFRLFIHAVNEQQAVQMIRLVLHRARQQAAATEGSEPSRRRTPEMKG